MSKTQGRIVELIEKLGQVTEQDIQSRGIPLSALLSLVKKGVVYKEIYATTYKLS